MDSCLITKICKNMIVCKSVQPEQMRPQEQVWPDMEAASLQILMLARYEARKANVLAQLSDRSLALVEPFDPYSTATGFNIQEATPHKKHSADK